MDGYDERYMQICSEKTLQTNDKGFFLNFADAVIENVGPQWINKEFGALKSDGERIRAVYQNEHISDYVNEFLGHVQEVYRPKSEKIALERLQEAAKLKSAHNLLLCYSQSVLKAPTGETLGLALLGRAKVLISIKHYQDALADLQVIVTDKLFSSSTNKATTFALMGLCHNNLNNDQQSQVSYRVAAKLAPHLELEKITTIEEDQDQEDYFRAEKNPQVPVIEKSSQKYQHASHKLKLVEDLNGEGGRFFVAQDEVKTGETLVVELPYAACLLPEKFGTHCHHCFARLVAPIGCPICSSVAFCGAKCREAALRTYHRYECKVLDLLIGSGMSVLSHTALRLITQEGSLTKCLEMYKNRHSIFDLCTNSHKRSPVDFLQRTLMAAFLLRCVQKSGFFGAIGSSDEEFVIGEMILFFLQMLQFNAHEVYETLHKPEHRVKGSRPVYVGVAVYPTVAMFNHDCYPSVTRYFVGKQIVVKATRPMQPGDLIAENYGPIFTWRKLDQRQRSLMARYWFKCKCTACTHDWPGFKDPKDKLTNIKQLKCPTTGCSYLFQINSRCVELEAPCPTCKLQISLEQSLAEFNWCEAQFEKGTTLLDDGNLEGCVRVLCPAIDVFHRISAAPHKETHLAQECLRLCFADSGNTCRGQIKVTKSK